ncbi:MAG: PEP-CTERM sorting domain-containing protein [Desulfobacula sp.]|nr:PEP-CTERM sorting domain-containing protein [Desulfobacula sp.]
MQLIKLTVLSFIFTLLIVVNCYSAIIDTTMSEITETTHNIRFDINGLIPQNGQYTKPYDINILSMTFTFNSPAQWAFFPIVGPSKPWKTFVLAHWYKRDVINYHQDPERDMVKLEIPFQDSYNAVFGFVPANNSKEKIGEPELYWDYVVEGWDEYSADIYYAHFNQYWEEYSGFNGDINLSIDFGDNWVVPSLNDTGILDINYQWLVGQGTFKSAKMSFEIQPNTVPIPSTLALFGLGLLGLAGITRRKK